MDIYKKYTVINRLIANEGATTDKILQIKRQDQHVFYFRRGLEFFLIAFLQVACLKTDHPSMEPFILLAPAINTVFVFTRGYLVWLAIFAGSVFGQFFLGKEFFVVFSDLFYQSLLPISIVFFCRYFIGATVSFANIKEWHGYAIICLLICSLTSWLLYGKSLLALNWFFAAFNGYLLLAPTMLLWCSGFFLDKNLLDVFRCEKCAINLLCLVVAVIAVILRIDESWRLNLTPGKFAVATFLISGLGHTIVILKQRRKSNRQNQDNYFDSNDPGLMA